MPGLCPGLTNKVVYFIMLCMHCVCDTVRVCGGPGTGSSVGTISQPFCSLCVPLSHFGNAQNILELRHPWGFSPEARRGSQGASRAAPGRLEGKPRTPLSSRVATRGSWSPLSGLKGVQPPLPFGERTRDCSPGHKISRVTVYRLDVLLFLFGTSLLFHVQF